MTPAPRRDLRRRPTETERILGEAEASLLDVVDNVLNRGVVLSGDLMIALARVDLIYVRLSLLLCAADRLLPGHLGADDVKPHHRRRAMRRRRRHA